MSVMGPLPEPEVLVKKVKGKQHAHKHGGAWKVAYADFVTAMMAFFLLLWLLSATNDSQRKGIADYFTPSIVEVSKIAGADGVLGGRSIEEPEGAAPYKKRMGPHNSTPFQAPTGTATPNSADNQQLRQVEEEIRKRLERDSGLKDLQGQLRFKSTPEGLRIELIDDADYSMFVSGTSTLDPRARLLLSVVANAIDGLPNQLAIRGHTDALPFSRGGSNNWALSSQRAEATRSQLVSSGVPESRISRLEGVAETDPYIASDPFDPRNRRMSITLLRR